MRVLLVADIASVHTQRWIDALAPAVDLTVAGFGELQRSDIDFVSLGGGRGGDAKFLGAVPRFRRLVSMARPDIIHAHFVSSYGVLADLGSSGRPVIQTAWGSDIYLQSQRPAWHRTLVTRALRRAVVVIHDALEVAESVSQLAPRARLVSVYFGPERSWTEVPRSEGHRILSPRQLLPLYNIPTILSAFASAATWVTGWTLDILTGGADTRAVLPPSDELPGQNRVITWPKLDRNDLQRRFLEAAIFCSVPSRDATSVALLEGMASGTFPIVSDVPANRTWITHGDNGLVVPARDVVALAEALRLAIDDSNLRRRAAIVNRQLIRDRGSWETAVSTVLDEYRNVTR